MKTIPPASMCLLAATLLSTPPWFLTGCGNHADVRVYEEVRVAPETATGMMPPHGTTAQPRPTPPVRQSSLQWETPEGWTESSGSGMRLASFAMGSQGEGLCTVVALTGSAGGLQANVARWLGQLNLTVPESTALDAFLEQQEELETESGHPVALVDLLPLTREQDAGPDSMIVAVTALDARTVFVKLSGPMTLLEQEKDNLRAFCRSLQVPPS